MYIISGLLICLLMYLVSRTTNSNKLKIFSIVCTAVLLAASFIKIK